MQYYMLKYSISKIVFDGVITHDIYQQIVGLNKSHDNGTSNKYLVFEINHLFNLWSVLFNGEFYPAF